MTSVIIFVIGFAAGWLADQKLAGKLADIERSLKEEIQKVMPKV
jgi:hypothetical protein